MSSAPIPSSWPPLRPSRPGERANGPELVPLLVIELRSPSASARRQAAFRCGRGRFPEAFEALVENLGHPDPQVRIAAVWALDQSRDRRALPRLVGALHDHAFEVRSAAAWALVHLGYDALAPVTELARTTASETAREMALLVLERISPSVLAPSHDLHAATPEQVERALHGHVHDLRNRLLVLYSAIAWVREASRRVTRELLHSTERLERGVDRLRRLLAALREDSLLLADGVPHVTRELGAFFVDFQSALGRMRDELPSAGLDGIELLYDLEEVSLGLKNALDGFARCVRSVDPRSDT